VNDNSVTSNVYYIFEAGFVVTQRPGLYSCCC